MRAKALELLGDVATTGRNPNVEKRINEKALVTLNDALDTYIKSRDERLSADTAKQYRSILQNFSGDWMKQPIASISRERVETRHKAVTDGSVWFGADKSTLRAGLEPAVKHRPISGLGCFVPYTASRTIITVTRKAKRYFRTRLQWY